MLKIGLLGASRIAPKALIPQAAKRDDCRITALACRDEARGRAYADQHGIADVVTSYDALVDRDDLDIIYCPLPPVAHRDIVIRALKAGRHVLCEKPFSMNADEAREMAAAAEETGKALMEAFHYRFHPAFDRVLEIVRSGRLGTLKEMKGVFNAAIPDRPGELRHDPALGGGALMDLGCYPVHACRMVAGSEPSVESAEAIDNGRGADLSIDAVLTFGDVRARIMTSMAADIDFEASLSLTGEKGALSFANMVHPHKGHEIIVETDEGRSVETIEGETTYDHQLDHFIRLVRGEAEPILPPSDAVAQMEALDAIYRAAGYSR